MIQTYRSDDWNDYRMKYNEPHLVLEPLEKEIAVVGGALDMLQEVGVLPHTNYDHAKMLAHRQAVAELFEIPWTAITPRMQRLLYAVNAIVQPQNMIAAGVFCGNTFISNAGAAVGPGACYTAKQLIGLEIRAAEAERGERNVRKIDSTGVARVIAGDAVDFIEKFSEPIQLLYIDADGAYLRIVEVAYDKMPQGSVVMAHNSANMAGQLKSYLDFVRDSANFHSSVNIIFDIEGLEVSVK
jgi:predicted O-methyltransferase YrrM